MRLFISLLFFIFPFFIHSYEVLTISDAIVDYVLFVDDAYLDEIPGQRGGSCLVDEATFAQIVEKSRAFPYRSPGGSAINMIKGLQMLGHSTGLMTTVGYDADGTLITKELKEKGIELITETSWTSTGKSACLVTPNGDRTMRTYLGASTENGSLPLHEGAFANISHFHLEGYQLFHRDLVKKAIVLARKAGASISIDLSSFEIVRINHDFIWELLQEGAIDLLFCNQEEAKMMTSLGPKEASKVLSKFCQVAIVTMGDQGCWTTSGHFQCKCDAYSVDVVDTIGAGDLFISGFLHGYLTAEPLTTCTKWATLLASHAVQVIGAEIPDYEWRVIHREIDVPLFLLGE